MTTCALRILSGMHADAIIPLTGKAAWTIGSDSACDVLLLDERIGPGHARLLWQGDQSQGQLVAEAHDIRVFGYLLKAEQKAGLALGSCFSLGDVQCEVVAISGIDASGVPSVIPADGRQARDARMLFLRKAHWPRYALLRMEAVFRPKYLMPGAGAMAASAAIAALFLSKPDLSAEYRADSILEIRQHYPNVMYSLDPVTGHATYSGYVDDQRQLGALRQLALKANYGSVVMNVLPMDVLALNVQDNIEQHYQDPRVTVVGPGDIAVDIVSSDAIKDIEGWDFQAVQARMLRELPELKTLTFRLDEPSMDKVRVPLYRLGLSVVDSPAGGSFAVDQRGGRLFEGAVLKEGHINAISLCGVQLHSSDDAAVFEAYTPKEKHDVCQ